MCRLLPVVYGAQQWNRSYKDFILLLYTHRHKQKLILHLENYCFSFSIWLASVYINCKHIF